MPKPTLLQSGEFFDAIVIVGHERFLVHRVVLATRSQFWAALFYELEQAHAPVPVEVTLDGCLDAETFQCYLWHAYGHQDELFDPTLLRLAAMFRDVQLLHYIEQRLDSWLSVPLAANLLRVTQRLGLPHTRAAVLRFLVTHMAGHRWTAQMFEMDGAEVHDSDLNQGYPNEPVAPLTQAELLDIIDAIEC